MDEKAHDNTSGLQQTYKRWRWKNPTTQVLHNVEINHGIADQLSICAPSVYHY